MSQSKQPKKLFFTLKENHLLSREIESTSSSMKVNDARKTSKPFEVEMELEIEFDNEDFPQPRYENLGKDERYDDSSPESPDFYFEEEDEDDYFDDYDCSICREDLCDNEFRIRLGGLKGSFSDYLGRFIGCEATFEFTDGSKLTGTIYSVGGGFIEVTNRNIDEAPIVVPPVPVSATFVNTRTQVKHIKEPVSIFPIRQIKYMKLINCC